VSVDAQILNGQVWVAPSRMRAVTQWIDGDRWVLLSTPQPAAHGGTCCVALSDEFGNVLRTEAEIVERLKAHGWKLEPPKTPAPPG
jgi:hypothetical protein